MQRGVWSIGLLLSMSAAPAVGAAQWDPEAGDVGNWDPPPPAEGSQNQQSSGWYNQQDTERPPGMEGEEPSNSSRPRRSSTGSDHDAVVGAVGIGFFGVDAIPLDPGILEGGLTLDAPAIGIRYWFGNVGLDTALGLGFSDFSFSEDTVISRGLKSAFGINVHLGLPVALHHRRHLTVELIPEIDFAYGKATLLARDPDNDVDFTAMDFNLTLRVGAEVQFGFIDLPQLGLQATIGLGLNYFKRNADGNINAIDGTVPVGTEGVEESGIRISTTLNNVFEGTIRIVYYLN